MNTTHSTNSDIPVDSTSHSTSSKRKRSMASSSHPILVDSSSPEPSSSAPSSSQNKSIKDFFTSSQETKRARPSGRSSSIEVLGEKLVNNTQHAPVILDDDSDVPMNEAGAGMIDLTDSPQPESIGKGKGRESTMSVDGSQDETDRTPTPLQGSQMSLSPSSGTSSQASTPAPQPRKALGLRIGTQPRKLVVKNLKIRDKESGVGGQEYFNTTWSSLDAAVTKIFNGTFTTDRMEGLYRNVESLCRAKRAPEVHTKLKARMLDHVQGSVRDEVKKQGRETDKVVPVVEREWRKWSDKLNVIRSIFSFLNQSYLLANKLPSLWDTGLALFRDEVLAIGNGSGVGHQFLLGLSNLFLAERTNSNEAGNLQIMMASLGMIKNLDIYRPFEVVFLQQSSKYFSLLSSNRIKDGSLRAYIATCSGLFVSEAELCQKFALGSITKRRLWHEIEARFVIDPESKKFILGEGRINGLLGDADITSLKGLYDMLHKVENPAPYLKPAWETYISETGKSIILDKDHEDTMIYRLLRLKGQLDEVEAKAFRKDEVLAFALRERFQEFVNMSRPNDRSADTVPRLLAKYCDDLMRRGVKALLDFTKDQNEQEGDDEEVSKVLTQGVGDQDAVMEKQFDACLDLFRFLAGKDVFEAFYKKDLAKRLLLSKSASLDAERSMMTKLKTECGSGFTHNMECMFKDIELSKEMVKAFKASKYGIPLKEAKIDLTVDVLSMSAWPTYPETSIIIPEGIQKHLDSFSSYYLSNHNGRKVMWRHSVGHCLLSARFDPAPKELVISVFQAVVLLVFNNYPDGHLVSYNDLRTATGLPDPDLKRTLQSLACAKIRVLKKQPKGRDINDTDKFCVHVAFQNPRHRIKINQIQIKETVQEKEATMERVKVDRQFEIQAAICRVMKSRRKMRLEELKLAVIDVCKGRGVLEGTEIVAGVNRLVEKDYLEETSQGSEEYVYVT